MNDAHAAALMGELAGIRAAVERIAAAYERMSPPVTEPNPAVDEAEPPCAHPEDMRTDFGVTNGRPDFVCRKCGYQSLTAAGG